MPVQTHQINVQGLSGGIFWAILLGFISFLVGFATTGWSKKFSYWIGLWASCQATNFRNLGSWFQAVQAMTTLGLIFVVLALLFIFVYMFWHSVSISKTLLLKLFVGCASIATLFMIIGLAIYGSNEKNDVHWSFVLAAIGCVFTFIGAVLGCVQMKRSNVI